MFHVKRAIFEYDGVLEKYLSLKSIALGATTKCNDLVDQNLNFPCLVRTKNHDEGPRMKLDSPRGFECQVYYHSTSKIFN